MVIFMSSISFEADQKNYPFVLPKLPYEQEALAPYYSLESVDYHYNKHHNAYVVNLNKLVDNNNFAQKTLEEIIMLSYQDANFVGVFNNAAQIWNHSFFWHSMKPQGGGMPLVNLLSKIEEDFGSFDKFREEFTSLGLGQFGSGWVWLVLARGKLQVVKTSNAATPITEGLFPILTCDVWEHAYYIDYRNRRADFLNIFLDKLVNWEFAEKNYIKFTN